MESMESMSALERMVDLRLAMHGQLPGARVDAAARKAIAEFLQPGWAARLEGQGFEVLWPEQGPLRLTVLAWRQPQAWHGSPADHVVVDHLPGDQEAAARACAALDTLGPPTADFDLHLDARLVEVRQHLLLRGLGIDSVTLLGRSAEALARLPAPRPLLPSLSIEPVAPRHVGAVVDLFRAVFSAHPRWCWFGAHPIWLEKLRADLERSAANPTGAVEVVLRAGAVVGHWATGISLDNALWGRKAGMGVVLHPDLQGQGLLKLAYARMLTAQVAAGVEVFTGGTSQPAVMGLGRVMGRRALATWIRRHDRTAFEPAHFEAVLAED